MTNAQLLAIKATLERIVVNLYALNIACGKADAILKGKVR